MTRDVVILGASGFVGGALMRLYGERAVGTCFSSEQPGLERLDLRDDAAVDAFFTRHRPRYVIHPAAQPNVDLCEREVEMSRLANVVGTENAALASRRIGARYVFFSTDYVFDGHEGPAAVDKPTNPLCVYGRHKLEAERFIQEHLTNYAITRVCGVYGFHPQGKNFVMGLLDKGRRGEPMRVPSDQWGTPTYVENLAEATKELAESDIVGIVHTVGPDYLVRIDFARLACEVLDLDPSFLVPTSTPELAQPAARPLKGGVDNRSTQARLATRLVGAREGLERFRDSMQAMA